MMFSLCCNSTYAEDDNVIISDSNTEEVEIVEEAEEETTLTAAKASVSVASSNSSISVASTDDSNDGIATVAEEEEYIESGTCGDDVIWTLDNDYNLVINGTGEMTSWTNYAKVPWYSYRKSIVSVTIDNGVTSIGKYAFYACAITSVVLPESVTNIEDSAFRSCSSLTNIVINGTVTSIGNYAFQDCSGLTSINLPEGLTSIGNYAFHNCTKLTSIVLPASITEITDGLFNNCTSLINVTAKGKLTAIGNLAFNGCTALTTLTNGSEEDTLTTIGYDAFYNCSALTDIPGLSKVDTMNINGTKGSRAFNGCSSLAGTINLSSLDVIPVRAFYGCKNIEGVTFSDNLTSIGNYAFCSCNKIRKLNFPDTLTSIGDYAFYNCFLNGANTVETEVSSGSLVYSLTEYKETLSQSRTYTGYTLKIPANVTYVGTKAFYASYVQVFDIGCSLTEIDGTAFATYSLVAMIFDNFETAINYTNKDSLLSKSQSTTSDDLDLIYNQGIAIFLDGINGNDENDGTTLEKAVKTFEKAKELAIEYETTSIYVTGTISISSGEQSWDGQIDEDNTINLIRYKDLNDASLIELDGGSLTLSNIIIDGKSISSTAALIRVNDSNSVLTITDGTVIKNNLNTFTDLSNNPNNAAVCVVSGKLVMTGGEITGNKGHWGGGIALTSLSDTSATMEMTGGTISNNTADEGGGIYMYANATLEMTGNPGGTITNNVSNDHGGGIYIGSGSVGTIYSGYITYNTSKDSDGFGGGGIYVNCAQSDYDNGKLYIYNVEIAYNKVSSSIAQSRGYSSTIACCETGAVEINVTDEAVIHDNETVKAIQVYQESASAIFNLSPIMLGGGVYNWTGSNGIAYELDELSFISSEARWINAITSVSTSDNTVTGLDRVKTYITGNEAVFVGAAIGSNGEVYIGKSDGDVNLVISKVWDSSINETLESIDVEIYKTSENEGTTMLDTITLSDDNNWSVSITNLPKYDSDANEYTYTVKEVGSDYFSKIVTTKDSSGSIYDEDDEKTASYSFTITNYDLSILTLEKNVVGSTDADSFVFEITLTSSDELYNGNIKAILNGADEITIEFVDGIGQVTLSANDSLDIYLKTGMSYTIDEIDSQEALDVTYTIDNGDTIAGSYMSDTLTNDTTISFENNYETIDITGTKTWDDADDQDGKRPDSITVRLLVDGDEIDSKVVTAEDNWAYTIENLQKYAGGEEIEYVVTEDAVENYSTTYDGYDITNSYTPEKTSITVVKAWDDSNDKDGIRPDEITVVLVKNGEATDQTITLNAENNWEASFTDLDVYSQGVAIEYTVEEVSVDGYTSEITGSMAEGFVITNTHTPEETPETPTEPTTPSAPEENTPSETTTPTATTETTPSTSTTETSTSDTTTETVETTVKTGDMTQMSLWIALLFVSGCGIVAYKKRKSILKR